MYAITFPLFKEVCTAGLYREAMKVGGAVCEVQNRIGKEDKIANKVENRISYAAAYALFKKYAEQNAITPEKFEKLNRLMAALYMCDPIVTQEKGRRLKNERNE